MPDFKLQVAFGDILTCQSLRTFKSRTVSERAMPTEQFVQLYGRRVIGQKIECAICFDVLRCSKESAPSCQSETRPERDAPHTEVGESGRCKMMIESRDKDIDRLWRDCIYDLPDLIRINYARSIKTISAGFSVRCESVQNDVQRIGITDQPGFATAG